MNGPTHALHTRWLARVLVRPLAGRNRCAGVSIIETLVAVVVIGIVIVPIFNSLVSGRMMTAHRGEKRMALRLVERKVEQLMTAGYGSSGSDSDVGSVNLDAGTHPTDPSIVVNTRGDNEAGNDVTGNLTGHRARILGMDQMGRMQVIRSQIPMAEVTRYSAELKSMTGGEGSFALEFSHYQPVPEHIQQQVVARRQKEKEQA